VITQLAFQPTTDALKLISAGEDFTVRIWDLVLNAEIAKLQGTVGRVTSFAFSPDMKTLVVGAKDSKVAFYNLLDNYKQIGDFHTSEIEGLEKETEVNAILYYSGSGDQPHLIIGGE